MSGQEYLEKIKDPERRVPKELSRSNLGGKRMKVAKETSLSQNEAGRAIFLANLFVTLTVLSFVGTVATGVLFYALSS